MSNASRTVVIPVEAGGTAPVRIWTKDPQAVLDYTLDWKRWLGPIDSINAAPTITVDAGLTLDSSTYSGTIVTMWLSSGTNGTTYSVAVRIVTVDGRTDERTFQIRAASR